MQLRSVAARAGCSRRGRVRSSSARLANDDFPQVAIRIREIADVPAPSRCVWRLKDGGACALRTCQKFVDAVWSVDEYGERDATMTARARDEAGIVGKRRAG